MSATSYTLRSHRPGDIGWIIYRHGVIYWEEYGWGAGFEGLVAEALGRFLIEFDPAMERCWIAESAEYQAPGSGDGAPGSGDEVPGSGFLGCVLLTKSGDPEICKLRMLLVEKEARGMGLGNRLVDECLAFARECGYKRMQLWTNKCLVPAIRIYERKGFRLIEEKPHAMFGQGEIGQTWELEL